MLSSTVLAGAAHTYSGVSDSVIYQPGLSTEAAEACVTCHSELQRQQVKKDINNISYHDNSCQGHGHGHGESIKLVTAMFKQPAPYLEVGWQSF